MDPYRLDLATPNDLKEVANFLNSNFFLDVPAIRMFGIEERPPELEMNERPDPGVDFIVKATSTDGDIIGLAVNRCKEIEWTLTSDTDKKTVQFVEFMHVVDKEAKTSTLPGRTVELFILSIEPHWRGKGLGRKLVEESITTARHRGFQTMKICCVNEFTAVIVRSLGFREFYKMAYSDYSRSSEVPLCTIPPHHHVYYYVKDLQQ